MFLIQLLLAEGKDAEKYCTQLLDGATAERVHGADELVLVDA